jgi:hypothetical protein
MPGHPLRIAFPLIVGLGIGIFAGYSPERSVPTGESASREARSLPTPSLKPSLARVFELLQHGRELKEAAEMYDTLMLMRAEDFQNQAALWTDETAMRGLTSDSKDYLCAIVDRWFELDPDAAKSVAEKLFASDSVAVSLEARDVFGERAAFHDAQWALDHLSPDQPMEVVVEAVAKRDARVAREWMDRENRKFRKDLFEGYVRGLAEHDPLAAIDLAKELSDTDREDLTRHVVECAARHGTLLVSDVLAKIADPDERAQLAFAALEPLARETQASPFGFLDQNFSADRLKELKVDILAELPQLVEANPRAAAEWASNLPTELRAEALHAVAIKWNELDPKGIHAWFENQSSKELGNNDPAMSGVSHMIAADRLQAEGKSKEAMAEVSQVNADSDIFSMVTYEIAVSDPVAVAEWVKKHSSWDNAIATAVLAANRWVVKDPSATAKWVEELPAGPVRDGALSGMIGQLALLDPEAASHWISLASTPKRRQREVQRVYESWVKRDSTAAREWVRSVAVVSEHWRTKFLRQNP